MKKVNIKKIFDICGRILMIAAIAFIGWKIYRLRPDFSVLLDKRVLLLCIAAVIIQGAAVYFLSPFGFTEILRTIVGKSVPKVKIRYTYCKSNLFKYLPGNVMHYVGRNQLAADENIPHSEVIMATFGEIFLMVITACILVAILSLKYFISWFERTGVSAVVYVAVGCGLAAVIILAVIFRKKLTVFLTKYNVLYSRKMLVTSGISSVVYMLNFLVGALISAFIIEYTCHTGCFWVVVGLSVMAWLIGFVTPGAPGGLGVREAIMTMFLTGVSSSVNQDGILTAVILYRIICILGDVVGYLIGATALRFNKKERVN